MATQLRALVGARVSVLRGEEKVSHFAQHETGGRFAETKGYAVVDTFEDLDISADKYPTFERPDLGPWLTEEKVWDWDVIIWSKIDRAFRSTDDCMGFVRWARDKKKVIHFVDDGLTLDYYHDLSSTDIQSMMSELFLYLGAFFAQLELKRFVGRALDMHKTLRHTDRWAGGVPPEGYTTGPHPTGKGRTLVKDPKRQEILHSAADKLLSTKPRWSLNGITEWLNDQGIETCRDYHRPKEKKKGSPWAAITVRRMLTSPATQGIKMMGRVPNQQMVLDSQGNPIQIAEPTFDDETWRRIQDAVQERQIGKQTRVFGANPLLGIAFCGLCGFRTVRSSRMYNGQTYAYYRCGRSLNQGGKPCPNVSMKSHEVESLLEEAFLETCGTLNVQDRQFIPGEDHTDELEKVNKIIDGLREDRELGLIVGQDDEARYRERMKALIERRTSLEKMPHRSARWETVELEQTYNEAWTDADEQGRRDLLLKAGIRFEIHGKRTWEVVFPEDMKRRLAETTS